jgi:hypothetical protein
MLKAPTTPQRHPQIAEPATDDLAPIPAQSARGPQWTGSSSIPGPIPIREPKVVVDQNLLQESLEPQQKHSMLRQDDWATLGPVAHVPRCRVGHRHPVHEHSVVPPADRR